MTQSTLGDEPFVNEGLFNTQYLKQTLPELDEWDCDSEAKTSKLHLKNIFIEEHGVDENKELLDGLLEDNLCEQWIDKVIEELGYSFSAKETLPKANGEVDRLLFESATDRRKGTSLKKDGYADEMFELASTVLEAKQWDFNFEQTFTDREVYNNASGQIRHYLEQTPVGLDWGILTNGRKWRLYSIRDYRTQVYFEVDLPELLLEGDIFDFKYFYLLFHKNSLEDRPRGRFLDRIWKESERYAEEVGGDLQDNVFRALRVLARGFTEEDNLDLDLTSEEDLESLKENSLVFLYRIMFILYAEGKDLINPEEGIARKRYERNFSLEEKRIEVLEDVGHSEDFELYEKNRYELWDRLDTLFDLIDEGDDKLDITAYNGGLFATEEHQFISENRVSDSYLAQVIYYLSATTSNGKLVPVRYSDLNTRHLGSVYEGLLEHQFKKATEDLAAVEDDGNEVWKSADSVDEEDAIETVEEGDLYVANDDDERKTTGSYYTPEYVVKYIIEETVAPLLEDIEEQLQQDGFDPETEEYVGAFASRVRELNVLDPAMGSGHFLTSLINYLTEEVQKSARNAEVSGIIDEEHYRRLVAKEVIYGTDNNEMAVELAKVSMWLETLAVDQPLAFLDHHLKIGNSVLGSDIGSLEQLAAAQRRDED